MAIYEVKPLFQKTLSPIANFFIHFKIHPTVINYLALITSFIAGIMLLLMNIYPYFLFIIPVLLFIRIAFNALDGMVARGLKVSSVNGEISNEFIDRLSDAAIFICLTFYFIRDFTFNDLTTTWKVEIQFIWGFIFIILFLLNSFVGVLAKAIGKSRIYSGFIGKADRMFYLGLACLIFYFYPKPIVWTIFFIFVIFGTVISIGQRLWKAVKS